MDFSAEVGWARQIYGTESNDYDQRPMASASARYGLSNWLTLEGHAEGGTSLLNAGMGSAFLVDPFGVVSLALAGSQTGGGTGGLINASLETGFEGLGGLTLYARTQMTFGDYEDIASVTTPHDWRVDESSLFNARVPKSLNQISLGLPLPFDRSVLNLSYTELDSGCGDHYQIAGVSYTHSIFGNATMFASVFKDFDDGNNFSAYVGISVPLGGDITVTGDVQYGSDGVSAGGDAMKSQGIEEGSYGWRVHDEEGEITDRSATASYRTSFAQLAGSVQQYGDSFHVTGEMDGSIAYAGGDLFFGNRIDDAFAVVDAGAPNVTVQYENRLVGETDSHGLIFVPSLNSYQRNKITIDPKNLPIDADVPETKQIVVPADRSGVVVKFGVAENPKAALITFVDEEEKPIGVGAIARLDTSSDTFIVGYDGQAYLRGLAARNSVTIERPDGGSCHAEFSYTPQPGQQVTIGNVICR